MFYLGVSPEGAAKTRTDHATTRFPIVILLAARLNLRSVPALREPFLNIAYRSTTREAQYPFLTITAPWFAVLSNLATQRAVCFWVHPFYGIQGA